MIRSAFILALGIAAASCAAAPAPEPATGPAPVTETVEPPTVVDASKPESQPAKLEKAPMTADCKAGSYAHMVGKSIEQQTFPSDANIRVLYPGSMATRDYRPDRLNIDVTDDHIIQRLYCG